MSLSLKRLVGRARRVHIHKQARRHAPHARVRGAQELRVPLPLANNQVLLSRQPACAQKKWKHEFLH